MKALEATTDRGGHDDALIARVRAGDRAAWSELVDRHLSNMIGTAWHMLGDRTEAEDVAQEVFVRFLGKVASWEPGSAKLSTWLYKVAVNLCIDRLRKRRPIAVQDIEKAADESGSRDHSALSQERQTMLRGAFDTLPERQKMAVALVYYQGLSNREAADILQVSVDALESLLARGRRALKQQLAPYMNDLLGDY